MTRMRSSPMLSSRFITRATWSAERDSSSMRAEDMTAALTAQGVLLGGDQQVLGGQERVGVQQHQHQGQNGQIAHGIFDLEAGEKWDLLLFLLCAQGTSPSGGLRSFGWGGGDRQAAEVVAHPHLVRIYSGLAGSSSSFSRRRRTWTSTVR